MIQAHNTFICKPGNAGKIAKLMKETMPFDPKKGPYILTDVTGQFHKVVSIHNYESLAEFEEDSRKMQQPSTENKAMAEQWKNFNDMYISGSREIYKVW